MWWIVYNFLVILPYFELIYSKLPTEYFQSKDLNVSSSTASSSSNLWWKHQHMLTPSVSVLQACCWVSWWSRVQSDRVSCWCWMPGNWQSWPGQRSTPSSLWPSTACTNHDPDLHPNPENRPRSLSCQPTRPFYQKCTANIFFLSTELHHTPNSDHKLTKSHFTKTNLVSCMKMIYIEWHGFCGSQKLQICTSNSLLLRSSLDASLWLLISNLSVVNAIFWNLIRI